MQEYNSLNHTKWECKYHIVWIPKCRKKKLYGKIRAYLGDELKRLARQKGCEIVEGHIMPDHIHILGSVPKIKIVSARSKRSVCNVAIYYIILQK